MKPYYGPPIKPAVNFKPQQTYGLPPTPIRQPLPQYGPPIVQNLPSFQQGPSFQQQGPSYPAHISHGPSFPQPIKGHGCDGWKPIPGPSFGTQQAFANSNHATIESVAPDNSYLPPISSNSLPVSDNVLTVQPLPTDIQLPLAEATNFHQDSNLGSLGSDIASGLGLTSINVVKSEGIEVGLFN